MRPPKYVQNVLVAASALLFAAAQFSPDRNSSGPVLTAATEFVTGTSSGAATDSARLESALAAVTTTALNAFDNVTRQLSGPQALTAAFRSYYAFKATHPNEVRKPYLYFVDYGLPSTEPRGYVFDMSSLTIVDGPFTVAHGRGSSASQYGVPTRFSDASGSNATSLGLYVAQSTYSFRGKTAGRAYSSVGVRLEGVSSGFNGNALARGVVAHGAPYVTASKAGRSEGCPAMEPDRAQKLLPKIAGGGLVFLYAPDERWLSQDRWVTTE